MNEFFDPFLAREVYKTADDLDGLYRFVEGVPDQALTAYKQWRQTIEEDPEAALEVVFGHPERVHLQRLYDVGTIYDIWRSKYRHFPEWRMSFDQWQSSESPKCDGDPGPRWNNVATCLPIPDWRREQDKEADAISLDKGNRARAAWKASPCEEIAKTQKSLFEAAPEEWHSNECDYKRELALLWHDPDR